MYHGNQPELGGLFLISIILVIIKCIPIIACPIIANNKGRSVFGWIMGGIFLGYIALIIIACLSSNFYEPPKITGYSLEASAILNAKKNAKKQQTPRKWECPCCYHKNDEEFVLCEKCGASRKK